MAKPKGPLMSLAASGQIGKKLIFSQRKSGQIVRSYHKPTGAPSESQIAQREIMATCVAGWQSLTDEQKAVYNTQAEALNSQGKGPLTGYNLYIRTCLLNPPAGYEYFLVVGQTDDDCKRFLFSDLSVIDTIITLSYGAGAIEYDDDYIYLGGDIGRVYKYARDDNFTFQTNSADFGNVYNRLISDGDYLFISCSGSGYVRKLNKSDLSVAAISANFGNYGGRIWLIGDYIYSIDRSGDLVFKLNKSDLSTVQNNYLNLSTPSDCCADENYLFVTKDYQYNLYRYDLSNLNSYIRVSEVNIDLSTCAEDGDYLYAAERNTNVIRRYLKSDLSYIDSSPSYGGTINRIYIDEDYVYVAGDTVDKIRRYLKSDLSYVDESESYGGDIMDFIPI